MLLRVLVLSFLRNGIYTFGELLIWGSVIALDTYERLKLYITLVGNLKRKHGTHRHRWGDGIEINLCKPGLHMWMHSNDHYNPAHQSYPCVYKRNTAPTQNNSRTHIYIYLIVCVHRTHTKAVPHTWHTTNLHLLHWFMLR